MRAALQCHERRHGRAHAELARFVVARGQHAATIARATDADRFSFQGRLIADFDRSVKAIHVEMDDRARRTFRLHEETLPQEWTSSTAEGRDSSPPGHAEACPSEKICVNLRNLWLIFPP